VCVVGAYDLVGEGEKKGKRLEFELRLGEEIRRLEEEETVSFAFLGSDSQQSFVGRIDFSSRFLGGGWVFALLFDGFLCFPEVPSTYPVADSCW
jgi:hypothetical protein